MRPSSVIALSAACVALLGIGALAVTRPAQAHKPSSVLDTATPTFTGTPPTPCGTTILTNGGFESGSLAPWIVSAATPAPLVSTAQPHTGSYAVLLGTLSGPEPAGDSAIYQTFTVPWGSAILSYWYWPVTADGNIANDWQDVYITDANGNNLTWIMHVAYNTQAWAHVTYNLEQYVGRTIGVKFLVHQAGNNSPTAMYVDDVSVTQFLGCGITPTSTFTPGPPTATPPPSATRTPTGTGTPTPSATPTVTGTPPTATATAGIDLLPQVDLFFNCFGQPTDYLLITYSQPPMNFPVTTTMRFQSAIDFRDYQVPAGAPGWFSVNCAWPCVSGTPPYTLTVDLYNQVHETNENNNSTMGYHIVTVTPCALGTNTPRPTITPTRTQTPPSTPSTPTATVTSICLGPGEIPCTVTPTRSPVRTPTSTVTGTPPTATITVTPRPPTPTTTGCPHTGAYPCTPTSTVTATPSYTPPRATVTSVCGGPSLVPCTATPSPSPVNTPPPPTVAPSATPSGCAATFSDVQPTDYFYTPVTYLACHGVISGYADGTFRPYNATTRSQMVKIVVLGFAIPITTPSGGGHTFTDVPPAFPFFSVIETAAAHNIVSGYTCGGPGEACDPQQRPYFRPYANVTRGQLAKITVVAANWGLLNPPAGSFADVLPGSAFYPFVETAYCQGIISGYNCGGAGEPCDGQRRPYFRPANDATRGQIAKIVYLAVTGSAACSPPSP